MVQATVIISALLAAPALAIPLGNNFPTRQPPSGLSHHHSREFGDIEMREPGIGAILGKGLAKGIGRALSASINQRELDDEEVLVREPGIAGLLAKGAAKVLGHGISAAVSQRELDDQELSAREPGIAGLLAKGVAKVIGHGVSGALSQRELDDAVLEMIARELAAYDID